ncbi:DUF2971 domain-containing protein [Alkalibacter rhizosphaerae]|uniref:DUF2971 domain-containing protein n=1 Tax=Alkalibacter rhizosphaerae TaxID=2815577 RepID=A0A974XP97_9FIRM|nr:DUF2971 domain-containing protein [Alkalibacter rhizosphaerae]QSX09511.1 DUF2971 domain-containing protein [Alkalibacter rhizosphaerae]
MSEDKQEYLYHYTNVSSLALILKNRNIKFNPLTVLDDAEEQMIKDEQQHLSKYCFVSSWTDDATESIPMWNMYTNISEGVRIRLPKDPFQEYEFNQEIFRKISNTNITVEDIGKVILLPEEMCKTDYTILPYMKKDLLKQVQYTDNLDELCPKIIHIDEVTKRFNVEMGQLGLFKNHYWNFQREWRYIFWVYPFGFYEMIAKGNAVSTNLFMKLLEGKDLPFNFYFLQIDPLKFKNMEITLSPKVSEGNRLITETLIEEYNPEAKIVESDLFKKIR